MEVLCRLSYSGVGVMIPSVRGRPKRIVTTVVIASTLLVGCHRGTAGSSLGTANASISTADGTTTLRVQVADDEAERQRGLMGRRTISPYDGMAFVWEEPTQTTFWMKDTLIPLSIAFWDANGRIVSILDMAPCEKDPCPTYGPAHPFVGALEVDQGAFEREGIEVGDHIAIEETSS
jgi:uncharacterized protein